jgi:hypothetical protein
LQTPYLLSPFSPDKSHLLLYFSYLAENVFIYNTMYFILSEQPQTKSLHNC